MNQSVVNVLDSIKVLEEKTKSIFMKNSNSKEIHLKKQEFLNEIKTEYDLCIHFKILVNVPIQVSLLILH